MRMKRVPTRTALLRFNAGRSAKEQEQQSPARLPRNKKRRRPANEFLVLLAGGRVPGVTKKGAKAISKGLRWFPTNELFVHGGDFEIGAGTPSSNRSPA
jgi:hypothetical protein